MSIIHIILYVSLPTGVVGWGVSIYLNDTLIPMTTLYRGFKYTFITETGNDPNNAARYHPFYITSSERGGYMTLSKSDQDVCIQLKKIIYKFSSQYDTNCTKT